MSEERAPYDPTAGMMNLRGKSYLPVAERIVWFRRDHPEGTIETIRTEYDPEVGFAVFRAEVCTGQGGRATATGSETARDFGDYLEKAETKAVGRALGFLGYGTAAAFDEGERVVDAPQPKRGQSVRGGAPTRPAPPRAPQPPAPSAPPAPASVAGAGTPHQATLGQGEGKREWTVPELLLIVHDHERPAVRRLNAAKMALTKGAGPEDIEAIWRDVRTHFPGTADLAVLETVYRREHGNAEQAEEARLAPAAP